MDGQYVGYSFYRVDPAWRRLPVDERAAGKDAFGNAVLLGWVVNPPGGPEALKGICWPGYLGGVGADERPGPPGFTPRTGTN